MVITLCIWNSVNVFWCLGDLKVHGNCCGEYGWALWASWPRREPRNAGWNSTQHPSWRGTESGESVASQLEAYGGFFVVLISYYDQNCDFTSIGGIWSRGMLPKVRYQSRIFRRDVWWKSTGGAGWKWFPPNIKPLFHPFKTHLFAQFKCCGSAAHLLMDFRQYLHAPKHHNPFHQSLTQGSNSSLRARGHVGCWVRGLILLSPGKVSKNPWKLVWRLSWYCP